MIRQHASALGDIGRQIREVRDIYFGRGETPADLASSTLIRSWERCRQSGLEPMRATDVAPLSRHALDQELERNRSLLVYAQPVMEHLYDQIRNSGNVVVLADHNGLLLQCLGDAGFLDRAERVALQPGAEWGESVRGTNAVGSALVEEQVVEVIGGEHFLEHNGFLTCSAAPLKDSQGGLMGVLDISGDARGYSPHTRGLVHMAAQMVEKRLFESEQARRILVCFHTRMEYLGSMGEGIISVTPDGCIQAINAPGLAQLGLRRCEVVGRDFSLLFQTPLGTLVDAARKDGHVPSPLSSRSSQFFYAKLRGDLPMSNNLSRLVVETAPRTLARPVRAAATEGVTLDSLNTGDAALQSAIDKARRIIGRDIPILVQGESGAGKEMFAKAFHNSGLRSGGPFVALNCAAIPETLIESELFGYLGGAFTGARKEGATGKIQQAHGGTLFLDEIGDMPLQLQARLLRVLQERCVTPLGSAKAIPVDISLVCATHRKLREEVARGTFREDLYYRLNGLCVTLPALHQRTDLKQLVDKLIAAECLGQRDITLSDAAFNVFSGYDWPGNIRELHNVIRVLIAMLDDHETVIEEWHLPDEIREAVAAPRLPAAMAAAPLSAAAINAAGSLEEVEQQAIARALEAVGGNVSAAARKLGISRNTIYRKMGRF
ncbi:MAG: sigma-54-dependent Fis family transcriptional regulator [Rhodocyclaceae bacterium]|nr:MAG: sigma-54-dependent Fis family transcriptional regulator [Rhodocyclaceae bacterium]